MADLPPEVLDRLAACETVRLDVGPPGDTFPARAVVAPVRGQLYLLLAPDARVEAALDAHVDGAVLAEDAARTWSVAARGRLMYGRRVVNDPRRSELLHWLPEGVGPEAMVAARFFPETLDYQHEARDGRRRAQGPVPGAALLPAWRRLWEVGGAPFWPWLLTAMILESVVILFVADPEDRNAYSLVVAVLAGALPVVGTRIAFGARDLQRWRKGFEKEESLGALSQAWFAGAELERAGLRVLGAAALAWGLLWWACGSVVVGAVALVSGAPLLVLLMAVRRRSELPASEAA